MVTFFKIDRSFYSRLAGGFLLLFSILFYGCSETELSDVEHVSRANDFYDQGDLRASGIELKNAIQKNPDNTEARWLLGRIYVKTGEGASAEKELKRAIKSGLPRYVVLISLAQAMLLQKQYDAVLDEIQVLEKLEDVDKAEIYAIRGEAYIGKAIWDKAGQEFQQALSINPDSIQAKIGQARLSVRQGNPDHARELLEQVIAAVPESIYAWLLLGRLEENGGNLDVAYKAYSTVLKNAPWMSVALFRRIEVSLENKNIELAHDDIKLASKKFKKSPYLNYVRGRLAMHEGDFVAAESYLEKFLTIFPQHLTANYYLGFTYFRQGHIERALSLLNKVYSRRPNSEKTMQLIAMSLARLQDYKGALKLLQPLLLKYQNDAKLWRNVGLIHLRMGDTEKGIKHLEKAIELAPEMIARKLELAQIYIQANSTESVAQLFDAVFDIDPNNQEALLLSISLYMQEKNYDKAFDSIMALRKINDRNPLSYNLAGGFFIKQGEIEDARKAFNQALAVDPKYIAAYRNLAKIAIVEKKFDEALGYYKKILEYAPEDLDSLLVTASLLKADEKRELAEQILRQAIELYPFAVQPVADLSNLYLQLNKPLKALSVVNSVPEGISHSETLLEVKGLAQLMAGQLDNAQAVFKNLINKQPESAAAYLHIATVVAAKGDNDKTRYYLNQVIKLEPRNILAISALARLEIEEKKVDQAFKFSRELKTLVPDNPVGFEIEAEIYISENKWKEATAAYKNALNLDTSKSSSLVVNYASSMARSGDKSGAEQYLLHWLKENPDDQYVGLNLGRLYIEWNQYTNAVKRLEPILKKNPNNDAVLNTLAWAVGQIPGKHSYALDLAEKAYLVNKSPASADTLGWLLMQDNKLSRAQELINEAYLALPSNPQVVFHLAQVLVAKGEKSHARNILEKLMESGTIFKERKNAINLLKTL